MNLGASDPVLIGLGSTLFEPEYETDKLQAPAVAFVSTLNRYRSL